MKQFTWLENITTCFGIIHTYIYKSHTDICDYNYTVIYYSILLHCTHVYQYVSCVLWVYAQVLLILHKITPQAIRSKYLVGSLAEK